MKKNDFNFKKKLGQNFLQDENIINKIVNSSNLDKDTLVIEIGAGSGVLTKKLCETAGFVISYEIDKELKPLLDKNLQDHQNISIIFEDFLSTNVQEEIEKHKYKKIHLVANLPYYITTPIVTKIIKEQLPIDKLIIMIQKEVGERFNAVPGTKSYNSLTVFLNYYYEISKVMDVSRNVFVPKPNVDSVVISMIKKTKSTAVNNEEIFFKLVRNSFQFKRKTLKNNLREYNLEAIEKVLIKHNLTLSIRAEQLPLEIFIDISNSLWIQECKSFQNYIYYIDLYKKKVYNICVELEGGQKMNLTSVNVRKFEKESSRMKGIASVLIDDCFAVRDIRIIEGDNGVFIAMPSRKTATGGYRDIAHPINAETRKMFEEAILEEYNRVEAEAEEKEPVSTEE